MSAEQQEPAAISGTIAEKRCAREEDSPQERCRRRLSKSERRPRIHPSWSTVASVAMAYGCYVALCRSTTIRAWKQQQQHPLRLHHSRRSSSSSTALGFHTFVANTRAHNVRLPLALAAYSPKPRGSSGLAREDFYSIHDAFDDDSTEQGQRRPYPPTLNSQDEDDGFGAYNYEVPPLDAYDQVDMQREQQQQQRQGATDSTTVAAAVDQTTRFGKATTLPSQSSSSRSRVNDKARPQPSTLPQIVISNKPLEYAPLHEEAATAETSNQSGDEIIQEERASSIVDEVTLSEQPTLDTFLAQSWVPGSGSSSSSSGSSNAAIPYNRDALQAELDAMEEAIYAQNNGNKFNINSPKQVATILFGTAGGGSTSKDVLEGMAGAGNRMADLILKQRALKYQLSKLVRRQESVAKGTAVHSASTVARPAVTIATASASAESKDTSTSEGSDVDDVTLSDVSADPLLLLDASAYIFRAYYSMPPIHRSDGMPTGAVMGFCKMLNSMMLGRMLQGEQPRLVLCFDAKGKTFRHELYGDYKGNRPSAPMDLVPQFELVRQAAKAYGICQIEAKSFEADDVIATLATMAIHEGIDANILSGDKDLMQLVTELDAVPSIQMIDPVKKDRTTYKQVVEKWEVPPSKLGDVLALSGDTADNIPGVRGIGPKNAARLINEFDSLENLLQNIESVKQKGLRDKLNEHKREARLSRVLVELNRTVPLDMISGLPDGVNQRVGDLRVEPFDADRILSFYDQMGFKELKRTFEFRLKGVKAKRKASGYAKSQTTVPQPHNYSDVPF